MCDHVVPPTVFLPPLKLLKTCSEKDILNAVASLRHIYLPEIRGSSRRHGPHSHSNVAEATHVLHLHMTLESYDTKWEKRNSDLAAIRADAFERSFAIQWLTRFVSLCSEFGDDSSGSLKISSQALEEAASLLAICAGAAASGFVTRTFSFLLPMRISRNSFNVLPTSHEEMDQINVIIRDSPLESSDSSSVGTQTWGGSYILAEMITENPKNFSICSKQDFEPGSLQPRGNTPFRALELGAGTGLASLVLGKVLERIRDTRQWGEKHSSSDIPQASDSLDTVLATDFHPSVLANLRFNFAVNFPAQFNLQTNVDDDRILPFSEASGSVPNMVVLPLDWSAIYSSTHPISAQTQASTQTDFIHDPQQIFSDNLQMTTGRSPTSLISPHLDMPFDLIIGADIIYEHSHARWVRTCVERFLRRPTRNLSRAHVSTIRAPSTAASGHADQNNSSPLLMDQDSVAASFHLIFPLRHTHAVESRSVEEVFPQAADVLLSRQLSHSILSQSSNVYGRTDRTDIAHHSDELMSSCTYASMELIPLDLAIISWEDILCDAYSNCDKGEVVYRYYRIQWV